MDNSKSSQSGFLSNKVSGWAPQPAGIMDLLPVLLVIAVCGLLAWIGRQDKSNTVDEVAHVLAGHAYWTLNDYRMVPESGNLSSRVSAIGLQLQKNPYPINTESHEWEISKQWDVAKEWWYFSGNDPFEILRLATLSMLLFNLLGLACIFLIASQLWGRVAGYAALAIAGFSPNFLGHMPLATSDFAGAWTLALATLCFARMLEKVSWSSVLITGLTAGLALIAKQSNLVFGIMAALLAVWRVLDGRPVLISLKESSKPATTWLRKALVIKTASIVGALIAVAVIWTAYGWRYEGAHPGVGNFESYQKPWITIHEGGAVTKTVLNTALKTRLLPEAYIYGIDYILGRDERGGYLHGLYLPDGYRSYFLWSFLYKTPLPAIPLHILGFAFLGAALFRGELGKNPVLRGFLILAGLYLIILFTTRLNIGYRHAFPLLFISCLFAGFPIGQAIQRGYTKLLAFFLVAIAGLIAVSATSSDRYISFVNGIAGGADRGYQKITDSSIDWGQEIPAVAQFVNQKRAGNPQADIYLAAHGTSWLPLHGLTGFHFLPFWGFTIREAFVPEFRPGSYIFSATAMAYLKSDWSIESERGYIQTKQLVEPLYQRLIEDGKLRAIEAASYLSPSDVTALEVFEALRCKRLVYFLDGRTPDKVINGSYLVFELKEKELNELAW